jgi:PKD repeat protein
MLNNIYTWHSFSNSAYQIALTIYSSKKNKVMKSTKFTLSLIIAFLISFGVYAEHVQPEDAKTVCKNYYWENSRAENPIAYDAIVPELFTTKTLIGTDLYYVFNINSKDKDGYVIVAADDDATPVLGYSFTGTWTGQDIPPALTMILGWYEEQLSAVINQAVEADKEIEALWEQYSKFNPAPPAPKAVSPLLSTTWNQDQYYNEQCPIDASGSGGHAYAGCAAVSMAQVMKYWGHPTTGTGSNSYVHPVYGTISANFGATTYSYNLMPNSISSSNTHIAQLLFHCGVSINMNYGPNGSAPGGTYWATDVENALKNNFNFSPYLTWKWRNNHTNFWVSMLKNELNFGIPLIYYGADNNGIAHQFNCDGYNNSNYFHFNLGWSGSYDGYYLVTNLNPYYNFTANQGAIFYMTPVSLDYGDAPDPGYPTLSTSGGACHVVSGANALCLGVNVDAEPDGQPHVNCTGDDTDILFPPANDDEDGVIFPAMFAGSTASLSVTAFGSGLLQAWLDYNQDNDWTDVGEQIFTNTPLVHGPNTLTLNIPAGTPPGWYYARFRYSSQQNIGIGGQAPDGEVEDYFFRIEEAAPVDDFDLLFSLDIGSDTELSDPMMDGDEVFDPGDAYLFNGVTMITPGADGYFDDVQAFSMDPYPDGGVAGTGAPCMSGIPIDQLKLDYFDMDGLDLAECDLRQYEFGEGQPSVEQFNDPYIHTPDSMYISFDDDDMWAYSDPSGSIPRMGFSSTGMLYGDQTAKDEILEVTLNIVFPNQAQVTSITPKYDELPIHPNLTPDPTWSAPNPNEHDDDVDALDRPCNLDSAARTYFSADHEATYFDQNGIPLNPGSIYLAEGGMAYEVINAQTDIGLPPDTDVDAFEFAWLFDDQNQYNALALVFSVDEDDPMTAVNESGGMQANKLYFTFMNGWWYDFTIEPFEDDIDALTFFASPPSNQVPKADFMPLNSLIFAAQPIQFTDLSTNTPTNWSWNFNGGNPANHNGQCPPLVVFANPGSYQVDLTVSNAFGSDTKFGTVNVLPANWQYVPTNMSHLISIPLSANPTVNGNPLNNGDAIGVFYTDLVGNVMCGGYAIWDGVNNIAITAYADDPTTPGVKEGFVPGEDFMWEVYSWSNGLSYPVAVTYDPTMPNFDGKYYNNGMSALTSLNSFVTQAVNLFKGWSGLSSYLDPVDKNIVNMFNPIISDLEILLTFTGVYWPTSGINTLTSWNPHDGYIIKVNNDVTLNITGTALSNRTLNLTPGWHLIPVLSSSNSSAASVLGVPGVLIAKEIGGNKVYWPSMGITTLATLETGKAYIVYVNNTVTITYPAKASAPPVTPIPIVQLPESWNTIEPSPNTHLIAVPKDVCQTLEPGDVVASFNAQGVNTGHAVYAGESFALAVYGDDQYTTEVDGMLDGEEILFEVYRPSTGEIFNLEVVFDHGMPNAENYTTNGLSQVALKTGFEDLDSEILVNVFPNPASHYLNINLRGAAEGTCEIIVINSIGMNVYNGRLDSKSSTSMDVSGWIEGCYFVRIVNSQNTVTKKIVIRK